MFSGLIHEIIAPFTHGLGRQGIWMHTRKPEVIRPWILPSIYQPCINPIHQSIQLRLFSNFKITCTITPNNESYDQFIYIKYSL